MATSQAHRLTPDCQVANDVVGFIHGHPDMLNARLITVDDLNEYRDWSNRLQDYAGRVSSGDLAPHLRRIAELSARAVAVAQQAQPAPPTNPPAPERISDLQDDYQEVIRQLIEEDRALIPPCRR
jgi:hypothetical protein